MADIARSDQSKQMDLLRAACRGADRTLTQCPSFDDALSILHAEERDGTIAHDLIVTDIVDQATGATPGFDVIRLAVKVVPGRPVIAITRMNEEEYAVEAMMLGARDCVVYGVTALDAGMWLKTFVLWTLGLLAAKGAENG